jgi:predicted RNA-binding Zn ribbon-like protein
MPEAVPWKFDLCGGHFALDLCNTLTSRQTPSPVERLPSYAELVSFAEQAGIASAADGARLRRWSERAPDEAERIRAEAVELREALYRIFDGLAQGSSEVDRGALAELNRWIGRLRLGEDLDWEWSGGAEAPDAFLAPVVRGAVELLTSNRKAMVRSCAADDCAWIFLDTSKNHSRRWCDMNQCGNRMKARRHYERSRAPGDEGKVSKPRS